MYYANEDTGEHWLTLNQRKIIKNFAYNWDWKLGDAKLPTSSKVGKYISDKRGSSNYFMNVYDDGTRSEQQMSGEIGFYTSGEIEYAVSISNEGRPLEVKRWDKEGNLIAYKNWVYRYETENGAYWGNISEDIEYGYVKNIAIHSGFARLRKKTGNYFDETEISYKGGLRDGLVYDSYYSLDNSLFIVPYIAGYLAEEVPNLPYEMRFEGNANNLSTKIPIADMYDIESMIDVFLKDCEISRLKINKIEKIKGTFEPLKDNTIALSYGINNSNIILKVDPEKWVKSSTVKKWYILYHELGHDVLNLEHGQGGRMMFNFPTSEYSWIDFFKDRNNMFEIYNNRYSN